MFFFFDNNKVQDVLNRIGTGRINEIIDATKAVYQTDNLKEVPLEDRFEILHSSLGLSDKQFDSLIADNSPVFRTVKGHAFEAAFEHFVRTNGYDIEDVGGDGDVDLSVNGHNLQLKTPNLSGTRGNVIEYKTHKTHGAKSEDESMDYYHKVTDFAEFFVGLISYNPFKVFIIPRERLPRHPKNAMYIQSPFKLHVSTKFGENSFINRFDLLGISIKQPNFSVVNTQNELMPKTANAIHLATHLIVDTIMRECNFRIWDMSIRGFAREIALLSFLQNNSIAYSDDPKRYKPDRGEKSDLVVLSKNGNAFIQVKGVSTNHCEFNKGDSIIATETQLTRGRVNDHPTQSRLYKTTDFDYLILAVEPCICNLIEDKFEWNFFLIPVSELRLHSTIPSRIAQIQKFQFEQLMKYRLDSNRIRSIWG